MIFVASGAFCQKIGIPGPLNPLYPIAFHSTYNSNMLPVYRQYKSDSTFSRSSLPVLQLLSGNYYASTLGFFCRQEIKLEKAANIPLKFRLGSVHYCDWLEGKRY